MLKTIDSANLIILNNKNQILLAKRSPIEIEPNKWCIPGGSAELNESFEQTIEREILEELNAKILEYTYFKSYFVFDGIAIRCVYFYGKIDDSNIILNEESTEYKWYNPEEIKDLEIAFQQKTTLKDFIEEKLNSIQNFHHI